MSWNWLRSKFVRQRRNNYNSEHRLKS